MSQLFKFCSIGIFILMSCSVFSQEHKVLKLSISDSTHKDTKVTNISSIEVKCALPDSIYIGIIPSELPNTRNILEAPYGIQGWLQSFVDKEYGSTFSPSGNKLLWSIDVLSAGIDSSSGARISFVKFGAEILRSAGDDSCQSLGRFDTVIVSKDAAIDLGQEIAAVVNSLISNSNLLTSSREIEKIQNNSPSLKIAKNDAFVNSRSFIENQRVSWKILNDTIYPKGVFMTFQEFKDNAPSVSNFLVKADTTAGKINLYQLMADSSAKALNDAWGVSINNELYKFKDGNLYPIEQSGKGYSLSKYLDFNNRKNQGFYWRRSVGIMLKDNNPFDDSHIYRVPIAKGVPFQVESTRIDDASGDLAY